ncbi:MAG TPA: hypothetical protein PKC29_04185 [Thermodesulfobacteriota bacterium]|nr:hypothetical protein [Thermodesulfobacteriota bacterium]
MKRIPASIIFTALVSAAWGTAVSVLYRFFSNVIPPGLYYPLVLSGVAAASGMLHCIPLGRAAFAGLASGFVYALLSPVFPLAGAVLSGACLGGGIARGGKPGILLQALKGALLFPLFIVAGTFVGALAEFAVSFPAMLFWASWLGLAAGVITTPFFRGRSPGERGGLNSRVREFSDEARGIEADLRELCERMR